MPNLSDPQAKYPPPGISAIGVSTLPPSDKLSKVASECIHGYQQIMTGKHFVGLVSQFFHFLVEELDFICFSETVREGLYYEVQYKNRDRIVSVSYENVEDYLQTIVFALESGRLPDYDDKTKTLHLNALSALVFPLLTGKEIYENNIRFNQFVATSDMERRLLKSAKELRLCLYHSDVVRSASGLHD